MSDLMTVTVTHTDTYCGEANYSWARQYEFDEWSGAARRTIVMRAKREAGLTGVSCDVADYGDQLTIKPRGLCQILFVDFKEQTSEDNHE
jgi:hypothetical protein